MSNVEFEENNFAGRGLEPSLGDTPALVKLILKTGLVQDEKQANYVLIGISITAFLLTVLVIYKGILGSPAPVGNFPSPGQNTGFPAPANF